MPPMGVPYHAPHWRCSFSMPPTGSSLACPRQGVPCHAPHRVFVIIPSFPPSLPRSFLPSLQPSLPRHDEDHPIGGMMTSWCNVPILRWDNPCHILGLYKHYPCHIVSGPALSFSCRGWGRAISMSLRGCGWMVGCYWMLLDVVKICWRVLIDMCNIGLPINSGIENKWMG